MANEFDRLLRKSDWARRPAPKATALPRPRRRRRSRLSPILVVAPLALAAGLFTFASSGTGLPLPHPATHDVETAAFRRCGGGARVTCVIDGDTFWYRGEKIRISDINAPETGEPHCPAEAARGEAATARMLVLLNQGAFSLERRPGEDDRDRYGRTLREVTRDGASLGAVLVAEGLAERWKGYRGSWC